MFLPSLLRPRSVLLALLLVTGLASAGEVVGERYIGSRFGRLEVDLAPGQWQAQDREEEGDNEFGGPVVDLKAQRPAGGIFPALLVSAFRKTSPEITDTFVLRASREAMSRRGADCGPVLARSVNGRRIRYFEATVQQHGQPARLYYLLLNGEEAFFAAQVVAPPEAFPAVQKQIDELLPQMSY